MRNNYPCEITDHLVSELIFDVVKRLENRQSTFADSPLPTGFPELDQKITGLHRGDLILIADRPGMGKSIFAANIISNVALRSNRPGATLLFSLNIPAHRWIECVLASEAQVENIKLLIGQLQAEDWQKLTVASKAMADTNIHICDTSPLSIQNICFKSRCLHRYPDGLGLIVIDCLQSIGSGEYGEQHMSAITHMLKSLATELAVPIILLSELDRAVEEQADKRPQLSNIFAPIELDADVVMFIYRDEIYNMIPENEGATEIIIAKQHNDDPQTVKLAFNKRYLRFEQCG